MWLFDNHVHAPRARTFSFIVEGLAIVQLKHGFPRSYTFEAPHLMAAASYHLFFSGKRDVLSLAGRTDVVAYLVYLPGVPSRNVGLKTNDQFFADAEPNQGVVVLF